MCECLWCDPVKRTATVSMRMHYYNQLVAINQSLTMENAALRDVLQEVETNLRQYWPGELDAKQKEQ